MRALGLALILSTSFLFGAACGGNDADPTVIPGGGIGSGEIDGRVNVYVIDADSLVPISGAKVRVGTINGMTDSTGLFVAKGDLSGAQNVAAVAAGHVPTMWAGVNGANVTIPVDVIGTPTVPQAELDGTIEGWAQLPAPAQGHATVAVVTYSQTKELGGGENSIPPPGGQLPANLCLNSQFGNPGCNFRVNARTGAVALFATITDRDVKNTPQDFSDDVVTVTGFALKSGLVVSSGVNQNGLTLTRVAAGDTANATVNFGTPPAALTTVHGIIGLDLGGDGVGMIVRDPFSPFDTVTPSNPSVLVPKMSVVAGAKYRVIALAQQSGGTAQSAILKNGLTDASNVALGEWLTTPTGLAITGDKVSFTAIAGAKVTGFDITASSASDRAWAVSIFDGATSVTVPTDLAPISSGQNRLTVSAIDAAIDVTDFDLHDKFDIINRVANDSITFTR